MDVHHECSIKRTKNRYAFLLMLQAMLLLCIIEVMH